MFGGIKENIYIVAKDDTARNWLQTRLDKNQSSGTIVTVDEITSSWMLLSIRLYH